MTSALSSLAARLTEPQDRETYAALISHVNGLPPSDELFKLVELLGLLALFGQRIPEASAELLCELRAQAVVAGLYRADLDARLASLPAEIAAGIDVEAIAKVMSERFRQQIADSGLQESATLLRGSSRDIRAMSGDIAAALRPITMEYKRLAETISRELVSLKSAARMLQGENASLRLERRSAALSWIVAGGVFLFVMGWLLAMTMAPF